MAEANSVQLKERRTRPTGPRPPAPYLWWMTVGFILLTLLGLVILWMTGYFSLPGEAVRILGRKHYAPGDLVNFSKEPPTSGLHYADRIADWGIHYDQIDELLQVSNLEKGGVIITYRPRSNPVLPDTERDQLEKLVKRLRSEPKYCKLILARRGKLDQKITITAWGRIDRLDAYDEPRLLRFIDAYINKGPESAPCL